MWYKSGEKKGNPGTVGHGLGTATTQKLPMAVSIGAKQFSNLNGYDLSELALYHWATAVLVVHAIVGVTVWQ